MCVSLCTLHATVLVRRPVRVSAPLAHPPEGATAGDELVRAVAVPVNRLGGSARFAFF